MITTYYYQKLQEKFKECNFLCVDDNNEKYIFFCLEKHLKKKVLRWKIEQMIFVKIYWKHKLYESIFRFSCKNAEWYKKCKDCQKLSDYCKKCDCKSYLGYVKLIKKIASNIIINVYKKISCYIQLLSQRS